MLHTSDHNSITGNGCCTRGSVLIPRVNDDISAARERMAAYDRQGSVFPAPWSGIYARSWKKPVSYLKIIYRKQPQDDSSITAYQTDRPTM